MGGDLRSVKMHLLRKITTPDVKKTGLENTELRFE